MLPRRRVEEWQNKYRRRKVADNTARGIKKLLPISKNGRRKTKSAFLQAEARPFFFHYIINDDMSPLVRRDREQGKYGLPWSIQAEEKKKAEERGNRPRSFKDGTHYVRQYSVPPLLLYDPFPCCFLPLLRLCRICFQTDCR